MSGGAVDIIQQALATTVGGIMVLTSVAALKDRRWVKWFLGRLLIDPAEEVVDRAIDRRVTATIGKKVDEIDTKVDVIFHEMHPNSSESMRDAIDRTEHRVAIVMKKVDSLGQNVAEVAERTSRVEGQVDVLARRG